MAKLIDSDNLARITNLLDARMKEAILAEKERANITEIKLQNNIDEVEEALNNKANKEHGTHLTLGTGSGNAFRGDYGNTAYNHSKAAHAPSNAQKNSDITKAEIEAKLTGTITTHTHNNATTSASGLMSFSDKSKLDGIAAGANAYTHPAYTAKSSGLYKITVDATGHVSATTAVAKSDITALGIPGSDTNTWRGVQDNLTSTAKDQSLSANQGKVLKGLIDGKLDASHANTTHLTIGTGAGNAAAGNHTHKYAGSSSAGGAATSADKVKASMKIQLNGGTTEAINQFTFNGSTAKNINITPSAIGLSGLSSSSSVLCYEGSGYDAGGSRVSLGCDNTVTGAISIGLGEENKVTGNNSLVLGKKNSCTTHNTFMIGIENEVINSENLEWAYCFLFGERNRLGFKEGESAGSLSTDAEAAYGSVALGQYNQVGYKCAVMGESNRAKNFGYAIGANNSACNYSLAIGSYCNALNDNTTAVGSGAYAGGGSYASCFGYYSRAEASYALAMGNSAYARATRAIAVGGKAEEEESLAVGTYSNAFGKCSAALTPHTYAIGENSVCLGYAAETNAKNAIAIGYQTKIGNTGEGVTAMGHFNKTDVTGCSAGTTGTALVIGNGTSDNARSNACRITFAGAVIGKAAYKSSGADYAEYFEWLDGNTDNEDRRGYFVTMDGNKIKKAKEGDYILGIVSAYPAVIGNNDMEWSGKFLLDEFGNPIKKVQKTIIKEHELIKDVHFTDEEMQTLTYEERKQREMKEVEKEVECEYFVLNPDFDPDREYVHRADRPEWDTIGMLGVLTVYDDGTCQVNGFCKCNNEGIATACERGCDSYRVIKRVNDHIIKIIFK